MQTISRTNFKSQLSLLLGDSNKIHWTDKELNLIINEGLYNLGAFGYFKNRGSFVATSNQRFYDITQVLRDSNNNLILNQTLTYGDLINKICYDLLESKDDNNIFNVFNQSEIFDIIDRRLDEFRLQTGLILSIEEFDISDNKLNLSDEVLDFIRVSFKGISNDDPTKWKYIKLSKEDEENLQYFKRNFNLNPKLYPKYFSRALGEKNSLIFYPPFTNTGRLFLIEIRSRDKTLTVSTATSLNVPDNFFSYIKFGVEEDLLKMDTSLKDLYRANYCSQRWHEGILVGKNYTSLLNGEINGLNSPIVTLEDLDNFDSNWQNRSGKPNKIALAGYNLLFLDKNVTEDMSLVLDVICNAKIPTLDTDFIDIKLEHIELLLNYCYHLAMFKEGFFAVSNSIQTLNQFMNSVMTYNAKLYKEFVSYETMTRKSKKQEIQVPRFENSLLVQTQSSNNNASTTNQ